MPRTRTDSFILELKLKTSLADAAYLEKCFSAGHRSTIYWSDTAAGGSLLSGRIRPTGNCWLNTAIQKTGTCARPYQSS